MKTGIIADIHGNHLALQAVLEDIPKRGAEQVYCLGDLVGYAPFPNEVIDIIRQMKVPTAIQAEDLPSAFAETVLTGK